MMLQISDQQVGIRAIESVNTITSKHTGQPLQVYTASVVIRGDEQNEKFLSTIQSKEKERVTIIDGNGNSRSEKYAITSNSYNYNQGTSVFYHTLELTEIEELHLTALGISDLTVKPYFYAESFGFEDDLEITAKISLSEVEHDKIKQLRIDNARFDVVRFGINESPVKMWISNCYWSQNQEGYKYIVQLSQEKAQVDDEINPLRLAFYWQRELRHQFASNKALVEALLKMLLQKNLLTADEVKELRKQQEEDTSDMIYRLFQVADVDNI